MSRTDQFEEKLSNPSELTIQWAGGGSAGHFKAYDPSTKEKIKLPPMSFMVLEERNCLDGYYAAKNTGAWSNEVSNLKTQPFTVMCKDNGSYKALETGLYDDIGPKMEDLGIIYHKVIYAMVTDSDEIKTGTIVRILLKKSAAGTWFKLKGADKRGLIELSGVEDRQNGAIPYRVPQWSVLPSTEEFDALAEVAYEKVDAYLKSRSEAPSAMVEGSQAPVDDDDILF